MSLFAILLVLAFFFSIPNLYILSFKESIYILENFPPAPLSRLPLGILPAVMPDLPIHSNCNSSFQLLLESEPISKALPIPPLLLLLPPLPVATAPAPVVAALAAPPVV